MNQDYSSQYNSSFQSLSTVNDETRALFYKKTYGHVAIAILLFIIVEALLLRIEPLVNFMYNLTQGWTWLIVLGAFMMATTWAEKMARKSHDRTQQYLGLLLAVVAQAVIFIPLISIALQIQEIQNSNLLSQAAIVTVSLFVALSAVVLVTKKDFSFLRSILTIGFIIAIGLVVAGMIFGFDLGLFFSGAMVLLAAGSILYQTSNMVHKYSTDQHVAAALGLFASLMLLFWYILRIFMSRD